MNSFQPPRILRKAPRLQRVSPKIRFSTSTATLRVIPTTTPRHSPPRAPSSDPLRRTTITSLTVHRTFSSTPRQASEERQRQQHLSRTPLYDLHLQHGAKIVPFGGYEMPLYYADQSHSESHHWTRSKASLFDVSHMVQHHLGGPGAESFLETITPSSISGLPVNHSTLSCLLDPETGGIVDDTVITRLGPTTFYFVTNAGCRDADIEYLDNHMRAYVRESGQSVQWDILPPALLALQGPLAASALENILSPSNGKDLNDLSTLYFGQCRQLELSVIKSPVLVSRGGYTGEDGFEIQIPAPSNDSVKQSAKGPDGDEGGVKTLTVRLAEALLRDENARLAGLAARDSLRLEAGMSLYGHDISLDTTPVAAGLSWIIGKDRREKEDPKTRFFGADTILKQLKSKKEGGEPPPIRRVGLIVEKGPPAREGASVVNVENPEDILGKVTSGLPSPTLGGTNIAMALVKNGWHKKGTGLGVLVRGKLRRAEVVKMPFVESKFYRG